jgi:hypothetical protein
MVEQRRRTDSETQVHVLQKIVDLIRGLPTGA